MAAVVAGAVPVSAQAWPLAGATAQRGCAALAGVIDQIGNPSFATAALARLAPVIDVGSWAAYTVHPDRPPVLHLSASNRDNDTTRDCFATYRDDGLYRHDTSFAAVHDRCPRGDAVLLRMRAEEAPSATHRDAIYRRHGLVERLSVARLGPDASMLSVNLYRHRHQGSFGPADIELFATIAPALLSAVARHADWAPPSPPRSVRALLVERCPVLTPRELDVLERLLQGLTYAGVAADLGLSIASVKTYRARAFGRLDIHFRNQLFAGFVDRAVALSADRLAPRAAPHCAKVRPAPRTETP